MKKLTFQSFYTYYIFYKFQYCLLSYLIEKSILLWENSLKLEAFDFMC